MLLRAAPILHYQFADSVRLVEIEKRMGLLREFKKWLTGLPSVAAGRSFSLDVLLTAARAFNRDNCQHLAAGIAYYGIFSLFPLLLGLIAIASLLLQSADARDAVIRAASKGLPGSTALVQQNIDQVLAARGTISILAAVMLLWSAKGIFSAITTSLNLAWEVSEKRPFWKLTGIQMALVVGSGFFLALSLAITTTVALISNLSVPGLGSRLGDEPFWTLATEPFSLALSIATFLLLYRFLPCCEVRLGDVWRGAVVAGVLFEIAKSAYVFYATNVANYQLVYGSLTAAIVLLLWAWISSVILLFGAEISAAYTKLKRRT